MKRLLILALAVLATAFTTTYQASAQSGDGWKQIFDGKSMDGFSATGEANWRVEDGALVADKGKGGHLVSKESYKDFHIYAEFWTDEKANSGIFVRCELGKIGAKTCYEMNIFDTRPDPSYGTGAIVYIAEANPVVKAAGKWNTMEVIAKGRDLTIMMNGQKTASSRNGLWEQGHFTLQYGGGVVKFRKVAIKTL